MSERIFKYEVPDGNTVHLVPMPVNARIISVGDQDGRLVLWAIVDKDAAFVHRMVRVVFTGEPLPVPEPGRFIGTVQFRNGLVVHVFDASRTFVS